MKKPTFLIAAPKSNSGKTLVTLGLIRALADLGLCVQPFKCGPDYIDPMHHAEIAGRPSYNLDLWMSSESHVMEVFNNQVKDADVGVVEGVMGLFDGALKDEGSSASVARLLDIPVVLVVDASSVAYSVAPLLYGFKNFDKTIRLAGVIFNKVAGASHYQFLEEAASASGVKALGYIPRDKDLAIDDRHLGLHMPGESEGSRIVKKAAKHIREHVDLSTLLEESQMDFSEVTPELTTDSKKISIAIASDKAFNFNYKANLDCLQEIGNVHYFSPLKDEQLPEADLLWLPGGYPELFAGELSRNELMMRSIREFAHSGKAVVAECGGMMYLGKSIISKEGEVHEMAGIFDFSTSFEDMKLHLGYRQVLFDGMELKGHEFHYSKLLNGHTTPEYEVKTARGKTIEMPVFRFNKVWASYMHLYLGEPGRMKSFLEQILEGSKVRGNNGRKV
ncbi:cobyrinate a,c-diamide synthase [Marinilabilia rubra]|uniref:Cobyrinate a,c-diamide synthase n=1 Tax=Marinilabilia rubra TaxID=2162893 RepID=A0A2U2B5U7_9BACT|nr:cobyrinate a,c-diamide synthase [Marinilabilia rubra]PWD98412.1 cobyrinate a,c-diamide synthase [Marinilabilia rubra]